jgi:hypothetical protein
MTKVPLLVFWTCAVRTGPFAPSESLYLKPVLTARQPEAGRTNAWFADDAPSVNTVIVAPPTVGLPTSG